MNLKNRIILEDYRKNREAFVQLGEIVHEKVQEIMKQRNVKIFSIEHRVKSEKSLQGKLERSGRYNYFEDLTDILGARIICYFEDEVDVIGAGIAEYFQVDWENSIDKRKQIRADAFGYLSLHYICSLPENQGYPEELCKWKFEIQIRTILQHVWSDIEHDLGYKSEFGIPRAVRRDFSRMAGLLEIADDEFVRIRDNVRTYTEDIRREIIENTADDLPIDLVSLNEYVRRNKKMRAFLQRLAGLCQAEISEIDATDYIAKLQWLRITTIGQLQDLLEKEETLAYQLAELALKDKELDIISSSVGLRYLCRAELLDKKYSIEQMQEFLLLSASNEKHAKTRAERLIAAYETIQKKKKECCEE